MQLPKEKQRKHGSLTNPLGALYRYATGSDEKRKSLPGGVVSVEEAIPMDDDGTAGSGSDEEGEGPPDSDVQAALNRLRA